MEEMKLFVSFGGDFSFLEEIPIVSLSFYELVIDGLVFRFVFHLALLFGRPRPLVVSAVYCVIYFVGRFWRRETEVFFTGLPALVDDGGVLVAVMVVMVRNSASDLRRLAAFWVLG